MSIRIVTDSTADIPKEIAAELNIEVVPLNVHFGPDTFKDGIDLTTDAFFNKLVEGPDFPSTSQPSVGEFVEVYESIFEEGDEIVSIHISSKLSGTSNSAQLAAEQLKDNGKIAIVDTLQASLTVGLTAIAAAKAVLAGSTFQEIVDTANSTSNRAELFALLDTLEYLEKGGRIGKARALLGGLLKIKPLITITEGEVGEFGKVRSRQAGIQKLHDACVEAGKIESLVVAYSTEEDDALELASRLTHVLPEGETPLVARVGPVIGAHAGPRVIALGMVKSP